MLHVKVDVGWQFFQWLIYSGTLEPDNHHRGPHGVKAILLTKALWLDGVLQTTVVNVFAGPWNSAALHQYVRQANEDFAHRPEFQDITRLLYEGIVREDDCDGDDIGTAAHLEVVQRYVGRAIEFGFFVGTTFSGEPGLFCAIATKLERSRFAWVPCEVDKQIGTFVVMQPGTKPVEDTIGHCKGASEQSYAMKLGPSAIWHSASTGGIVEGL